MLRIQMSREYFVIEVALPIWPVKRERGKGRRQDHEEETGLLRTLRESSGGARGILRSETSSNLPHYAHCDQICLTLDACQCCLLIWLSPWAVSNSYWRYPMVKDLALCIYSIIMLFSWHKMHHGVWSNRCAKWPKQTKEELVPGRPASRKEN